jgi:hypothetical protein
MEGALPCNGDWAGWCFKDLHYFAQSFRDCTGKKHGGNSCMLCFALHYFARRSLEVIMTGRNNYKIKTC